MFAAGRRPSPAEIALCQHFERGRALFQAFEEAYNGTNLSERAPGFQNCDEMLKMSKGKWTGLECKYQTDQGRWLTVQVARFSKFIRWDQYRRENVYETVYEAKLFDDKSGRLDYTTNFAELQSSVANSVGAALTTITGEEFPPSGTDWCASPEPSGMRD